MAGTKPGTDQPADELADHLPRRRIPGYDTGNAGPRHGAPRRGLAQPHRRLVMATLGTLTAKVLIQIGDGEPIEVGVMDVDLIAKSKPVMRGGDVHINLSPDFDVEATTKSLVERFQCLGHVAI